MQCPQTCHVQHHHTTDQYGGALRRVPCGVVHSWHYIISELAEKVIEKDRPHPSKSNPGCQSQCTRL
jgi:hypothetical protein